MKKLTLSILLTLCATSLIGATLSDLFVGKYYLESRSDDGGRTWRDVANDMDSPHIVLGVSSCIQQSTGEELSYKSVKPLMFEGYQSALITYPRSARELIVHVSEKHYLVIYYLTNDRGIYEEIRRYKIVKAE